ncbi:MAG: protein-L-isoaspartate(D-aspartate) O-methyltransferase [Planctomycetes bacterium]|nr:protein-L-isoaspartate(D-aspartate) O-methyltransferase [Planctomycetota bacterium]
MTSARTRARLADRLAEEGIRDRRVLDAIAEVPRHIFVDEALATRAYEDTALPIGQGQTISQPYMVARMTELLVDGGRLGRCLEIGSGCGYQSAVLARFCDRLYGVERIRSFVFAARERLHTLGIGNIRLRHGDGFEGWKEHAPFDGILIAAAPPQVPAALLEQLADGGRLVVPVGTGGVQSLKLVVRSGDSYEEREVERVSFVPMLAGIIQ